MLIDDQAPQILVPLRVARSVQKFFEQICRCGPSDTLPRDPERGRVIALSTTEIDLMIVPLQGRVDHARLALAAIDRRRTQIAFRVPVLGSREEPRVDLALFQPTGALVAGGYQLWADRSSWWIVPTRNSVGRYVHLGEQGCFQSLLPPWRDQAERCSGFVQAGHKLAEVVGIAPNKPGSVSDPGKPLRTAETFAPTRKITPCPDAPPAPGQAYPSLYTATMVEPYGQLDRMFFAAFVCDRERDAYPRLARRIGLVSADRAAIRAGFDESDPITSILVSNLMCELLEDAVAHPASAARDGLDLLIERRFTALRAARTGRTSHVRLQS